MPDGDEQPVKAYLAPPAGMAHGDAAQLRIAKQLFDRGVEDELDVILGFERLYELFFAAEAAAAMDEIDLAAGLAQKHSVLKRAVAAAVDRHVAPLVECAVAHRAEADAVPDQLLLMLKPEHSGLRAGCDDESLRLKLRAGLAAHELAAAAILDGYDLLQLDLRALLHGLLKQPVAKLGAAYGDDGREIFNFRRPRDLPAERGLLYHQHRFSGAAGVCCRGKPRRAAANYNYIVHSYNSCMQ